MVNPDLRDEMELCIAESTGGHGSDKFVLNPNTGNSDKIQIIGTVTYALAAIIHCARGLV